MYDLTKEEKTMSKLTLHVDERTSKIIGSISEYTEKTDGKEVKVGDRFQSELLYMTITGAYQRGLLDCKVLEVTGDTIQVEAELARNL